MTDVWDNTIKLGDLLYENPLAGPDDVRGFRMEGPGVTSFPRRRMRLESTMDPGSDDQKEQNQKANLVFWCPQAFPDHVLISWDFWPRAEPGLAILFFSATGKDGQDVLDPGLSPRNGPYGQYHHGDIHASHVSYFRRRYNHERSFYVCNLRKSYGFHMVAQGADPIPSVKDAVGPYRISVLKSGPHVVFHISDTSRDRGLEIFRWRDDGATWGPLRQGGKLGFRQMAPLVAEYANLTVHAVQPWEPVR